MTASERIQRLLDPQFVAALDRHDVDALRELKAEASDIELSVSYYRRLAQARMEILEAERARRERGGDISELVADLPRILGSGGGRAAPADSRVPDADTPAVELKWEDGREELVADLTLANLPTLDEAELADTVARLSDFERELSDIRRDLHGVIDALEREIATRQVAGTA